MECLEIYKINRNVIDFISTIMPSWSTSLILNHNQGTINVPNVKIKRGIYQGDSLSPLIFIMTIGPLSKLLNNSNTGYNLKNRYEHPKYDKPFIIYR